MEPKDFTGIVHLLLGPLRFIVEFLANGAWRRPNRIGKSGLRATYLTD